MRVGDGGFSMFHDENGKRDRLGMGGLGGLKKDSVGISRSSCRSASNGTC